MLEGKVERDGEGVRFNAFSPISPAAGWGRRTMEALDARQAAHQVSDEVVKLLTGERGIASTQVAFIHQQGDRSELCVADYDGHNLGEFTTTGTLIDVRPGLVSEHDAIAFSMLADGSPDLFLWSLAEGRARRSDQLPGSCRGRLVDSRWQEGGAHAYQGWQLRDLHYEPGRQRPPPRDAGIRASTVLHHGLPAAGRSRSHRTGRAVRRSTSPTSTEPSVRRLTFTGEYNESAAWSPKGDRIAYVAREAGFFDVWVMDPLGRHRRRITFKGTTTKTLPGRRTADT